MKSFARRRKIGDPSLQGVRLDLRISGIEGDANTTRPSPMGPLGFRVRGGELGLTTNKNLTLLVIKGIL